MSPESIAAAFTGRIKRPRVGIFYQLALALVSGVMVLLPLLYVALIGVVVYGVYWHATEHLSLLNGKTFRGRAYIFALFLYLTPIFIGGVIALFMIKPLFARFRPKQYPYALNPENEPTLYAFIQKVCETVGAPMPSLIELDCGINASARLRRGFGSFLSNDLVLTIGLPLVAALNTQQLAGVLAHEFGHFSQTIFMRLYYTIGSINEWFARVVYERDEWDESLERSLQESEDGWVTIAIMLAMFGVGISRFVLQILMFFAHALSCFMARQAEFHADRFEIRLAGSVAFEETVGRLEKYNALFAAGLKEARVGWNLNKRLPDNLPAFLAQKELQLGDKIDAFLKGQIGHVKTRMFDTHPSDAARVRQARLAKDNGIFHLKEPATELFENFPIPASIVTRLQYEAWGIDPRGIKLVPTEMPARAAAAAVEEPPADPFATVARFYSGIVTEIRRFMPRAEAILPAGGIPEALHIINDIPNRLAAARAAIDATAAKIDASDAAMVEAARRGSHDPEVLQHEAEKAAHLHALRTAFAVCEERLALARAVALAKNQNHEPLAHALRAIEPSLAALDTLRKQIAANEAASLPAIQADLSQTTCPLTNQPLWNLFLSISPAAEPAALADFLPKYYLELLGELTARVEKALR